MTNDESRITLQNRILKSKTSLRPPRPLRLFFRVRRLRDCIVNRRLELEEFFNLQIFGAAEEVEVGDLAFEVGGPDVVVIMLEGVAKVLAAVGEDAGKEFLEG